MTMIFGHKYARYVIQKREQSNYESLICKKITHYHAILFVTTHSPPPSLCVMEVNEIFSKYFANYYKITQ